jgi:hypothetical protein
MTTIRDRVREEKKPYITYPGSLFFFSRKLLASLDLDKLHNYTESLDSCGGREDNPVLVIEGKRFSTLGESSSKYLLKSCSLHVAIQENKKWYKEQALKAERIHAGKMTHQRRRRVKDKLKDLAASDGPVHDLNSLDEVDRLY